MKNILSTISIALLLLGLSGCSGKKPRVSKNGEPNWIYNPQDHKLAKGKLVGIGIAGENVSGRQKQREMAVSRGIDEIAKQKGVKVDNTTQTVTVGGTGTRTKSGIKSYSVQSVNGNSVTASKVAEWYNRNTRELFVLMVGE
jgi:hypothetical protein